MALNLDKQEISENYLKYTLSKTKLNTVSGQKRVYMYGSNIHSDYYASILDEHMSFISRMERAKMYEERFSKCLNIRKDNSGKLIYKLKFTDGSIEDHTDGDPILKNVINLKAQKQQDKTEYIYDMTPNTLLNYQMLESDDISEESEKAYMKSLVAGSCTSIEGSDYVQSGTIAKDLVITDRANRLQKSITAKTITFVGNKRLRKEMNIPIPSIELKCRKAILKNRTLMSNLLGFYLGEVVATVKARHIFISHDFVDLNTVYEVLIYLDVMLSRQLGQIYPDTIVQVDFEKAGVDLEKVADIVTKDIIAEIDRPNRTESLDLSYMSWALSMYASTGYQFDKLLEQATICNEYIKSAGKEEYRKKIEDLNRVLNSFYNGYRC